MKKLIFAIAAIITISLSVMSLSAFAASYGFEDSLGGLKTVTNTLGGGGRAAYTDGFIGKALKLDGSYGVELGSVGSTFSVSAMVNISSSGDAKTVFFKNMGSAGNQKWTGVIYDKGVPSFWTHDGGSYSWAKSQSSAGNRLNQWVQLTYVENNGSAALYVDGVQVSAGAVVNASGTMYMGATYWNADAPVGIADEVELFDKALTSEEVTEIYNTRFVPHLFEHYSFPMTNLVTDLDLSQVPGGSDIVWVSDNEDVLSSKGVVTRGEENTTVTLTGTFGEVTRQFEFIVLGKPAQVNDRVILSYKFGESALLQEFDGAEPGFSNYAADLSGNGNHGTIYGRMTDGYFDGADDYVQMPKGILQNHDEFTLLMRLTPEIIKTHQFTFCFGNNTDEYFFLNTSRPATNNLRLAITNGGSGAEKDLAHTPGLRSGEKAVLTVTAKGTEYKIYLNGIPVASGDLGLKVSDFGETTMNYLAKSPYNDPLYKGRIDEFTIYSYAMDEEEVYRSFHSDNISDGSYITDVYADGSILNVELARDCVVAVSMYGLDDGFVNATTKKVSGDSLAAAFDTDGAVSFEIVAFDGNTGIVKDKMLYSYKDYIIAFARSGDSVVIDNAFDEATDVAVMVASYDDERLTALSINKVTVKANSRETVRMSVPEGSRLMVWRSVGSMIPVEEK